MSLCYLELLLFWRSWGCCRCGCDGRCCFICAHQADNTAGNRRTHRHLLVLIGQCIGNRQRRGKDLRIKRGVQIDGFAMYNYGATHDAIETEQLQIDAHENRRNAAILLNIQITELEMKGQKKA